jgi:AcrR family transcriptional regulator
MKNETRTAQTRAEILKATIRVVAKGGIPKLTLDSVAREAGVSKGGLLYHFPTKEALIKSLIELFISEWNLAMQREYDADPTPEIPGRWVRAYVRTSFADFEFQNYVTLSFNSGDITGTLGALTTNPELMTILQREYGRWHKLMISDGIDAATATAIRFAADGIYFSEAFGFAPPKGRARKQTRDTILAWATPLKTEK